jgi:hypothetical protein
MDSYRSGSEVVVSVPFVDRNGIRLTPTAISWRLLNDEAAEVKSSATIGTFDVDLGKVDITVAGTYNTLGASEAYGLRRVEATLTVGGNQIVVTSDYLLDAAQPFVAGVNSFMTYETALVQARFLGPLVGWDAASEDERKAALFKAYDAMSGFVYEFRYVDDETERMTLKDLAEAGTGLTDVKPTQIVDFRRAQLLQADYILGGNQIEKDIGDGLQSSTIGEVSQFFRPRATLTLAICRAALAYVGRYICWGLVIGRA